jgi:hypothetical protein
LHDLAAEVEVRAYRVAEEVIRTLQGSMTLELNVDRDRDTLQIELAGSCGEPREQLLGKLAPAQARLELSGGTLHTISRGDGRMIIAAALPLHPTPAIA